MHRAMVVTVLAWIVVFWFNIPLIVPAAATAAAVFVTLGVLANGYRSNASVQEQQQEWQQLHEVDQKVRSTTKQLKQLQRKQRRAQGAAGRRREKVALRLQRSQAAEQAELQRHDQKLQEALAGSQRRRDLEVQNALNTQRSLEAKHAGYVVSVDNQIGGLRQLEENELQQTLKRRQQQFVASYMKRQTIDAAIIAGIGPAAKQALRKQGIVRAEDLEYGRLVQIEGIGDAKARVLMEWRRKAESLALQAAPQSLSKIEETLIRGRYFQRRFSLEQEKVKAQRRLAKEIAAAQEASAARLKALGPGTGGHAHTGGPAAGCDSQAAPGAARGMAGKAAGARQPDRRRRGGDRPGSHGRTPGTGAAERPACQHRAAAAAVRVAGFCQLLAAGDGVGIG